MRVTIFSLLAAATLATAQSTDAPVVTNNPLGAVYIATLPTKQGSELQGSITATSSTNGKGVLLAVSIKGLPKEGGPFMYHIHEKPVPADGNCTGTGAHLDPYKRGEAPICDASKPQTCQTGDLSGKHGKITGQDLTVSYTDDFLATNPTDLSYFGNLSIVVHLSNKTRIGCANFNINAQGNSTGIPSSGYALPTGGHFSQNTTFTASATASGTNAPTGTPISPTSTSSPLPSSGAQKLIAGAGVLAAGVAAMIL